MTWLAVSPHLDDAVFSAGATLAAAARAGERVVIATVFTASVPEPRGFALACQLDKGLAADVDYMALRRAEDRDACGRLGAEPLHLDFAEAPHRGYDSAAALFAGVRADDDVGTAVAAVVAALIARLAPARVFGPLGIGNHADHLIVRDALLGIVPDAVLWADWPYADRANPDEAVPGPLLNSVNIETKIAAASAYVSQIGFQFGSAAAMAARLRALPAERFRQ